MKAINFEVSANAENMKAQHMFAAAVLQRRSAHEVKSLGRNEKPKTKNNPFKNTPFNRPQHV